MEVKNLGQLLQHLATKAGIDANDQNLINILSNSELSKITVHSDVIKALDENLLSVDVAKDNHPEISKVYKAQVLNAFDKKMDDIISELGLPEDKVTELKGIKNTYQRYETLTALIKSMKAATPNKEDKNALQEQVDTLLEDIKKINTDHAGALEAERLARKNDKIGFYLLRELDKVKTVFDGLESDARNASINVVIGKALKDRDAEFDFDDKDNFIVRTKDGSSLLGANHTKYNPKSFIDEVLAQNKLIVVNTPPAPPKKEGSEGKAKVITADTDGPKGNNRIAELNRLNRQAFSEEEN